MKTVEKWAVVACLWLAVSAPAQPTGGDPLRRAVGDVLVCEYHAGKALVASIAETAANDQLLMLLGDEWKQARASATASGRAAAALVQEIVRLELVTELPTASKDLPDARCRYDR